MKKEESNNWIEGFKSWIRDGEVTDAPDIFVEASALAILSAIVNRNIYVTFGHRKVFPSMWLLLLGKSGICRKSTCIDLVSKFVIAVKPNMILEQAASSEFFVQSMAERQRAILIEDEFITMLDSFKKEYASLIKRILVELYDREIPWTRGTMGGGQTSIQDPFLNILTATTPAWLQQALTESDIKGGLYFRFLVVLGKENPNTIDVPGYGDEDKKKELIQNLDMISKMTYKAELSEEAKKVFIEYSRHLNEEGRIKGDMIASFNSRLSIYALKLSILYHASDMDRLADESISKKDMEQSVAFMRKVSQSQEKILSNLAFSPYQLKRQKVLDVLEWAGEKGIMHSDLMRKLQVPKHEFYNLIDSLTEEEFITSEMLESTGSKPARWYKLVKQ